MVCKAHYVSRCRLAKGKKLHPGPLATVSTLSIRHYCFNAEKCTEAK